MSFRKTSGMVRSMFMNSFSTRLAIQQIPSLLPSDRMPYSCLFMLDSHSAD